MNTTSQPRPTRLAQSEKLDIQRTHLVNLIHSSEAFNPKFPPAKNLFINFANHQHQQQGAKKTHTASGETDL